MMLLHTNKLDFFFLFCAFYVYDLARAQSFEFPFLVNIGRLLE